MKAVAIQVVEKVRHDCTGFPEGDYDRPNEFLPGATYRVPADVAQRFIALGWAHEPGKDPLPKATQPVTLDILDATLSTAASQPK